MSTPPTVPKFVHPEEVPAALQTAIDSLKEYGMQHLARHLEEFRNAANLPLQRDLLIDVIVLTRLHISDTMKVLDAAEVPKWVTGLGRVLPLLEGATRRLRAA